MGDDQDSYDPSLLSNILSRLNASNASAQSHRSTPAPVRILQPPRSPLRSSAASLANAASVTTWSAALQYMMTLLAADPVVLVQLKRMRSDQNSHEQQWWNARVAIEKQFDDRKKLESLLSMVGGKTSSNVTTIDTELETALTTYDTKVLRAIKGMRDAQRSELEILQIPFFVTATAGSEHEENRARMMQFIDDLTTAVPA
ncbi:hypothetical protein G7K_4998-t1 [Saitoella complicata NRRL Y-17804]|uniref:Uncharacterized protein n=2 Tax=Saitoella complicata (strain BCRC 22490 / CBS 7301 / JCM 7358 / NBRC 10748 / NRRL Y-17804) TaxID=698492 RepID=A0A0E9NM24_SAICN|nr:hypothetical protein G7K_4998-t1 [Saitoella complicata NRRL Y-17804]